MQLTQNLIYVGFLLFTFILFYMTFSALEGLNQQQDDDEIPYVTTYTIDAHSQLREIKCAQRCDIVMKGFYNRLRILETSAPIVIRMTGQENAVEVPFGANVTVHQTGVGHVITRLK